MRLFGWRRKPAVPDPAPVLPDPLERLRMIENELRQVRLQVEFMRTRLSCYVGDGIAQSFQLGLSDRNCMATFQYPKGHLGGGHIDRPGSMSGHVAVEAEIRRLDDLLGPDFRCNLVKIDVEGHELQVLDGMRRIVE